MRGVYVQVNETTYACSYDPQKVGEYIITISFGGQQISKSPFIVDVGPAKATRITAHGPGLEGGVVGQPATFIVETHGETGALGSCTGHTGTARPKLTINYYSGGLATASACL